jgi:murein DD-endopeptidase MepM/ murein hydrolase activator NlpD
MTTVRCPRCGGVVPLYQGRPRIRTSGSIELFHARCWGRGDEGTIALIIDDRPGVFDVTSAQVTRRRPRWRTSVVVASAAIGIGLAYLPWRGSNAHAEANVSAELSGRELVGIEASGVREIIPPPSSYVETPLQARFPVPRIGNERLDAMFPSLDGWIHPVTASDEILPSQGSRRFGATRVGVERAECGAGHCGVDLDGPRGRPIVAVAAGTVVHIEHSELGRDGRSGRYVRIEHDDGALTAYMHLDRIAPGLESGDRVDAGQYLGTLGATAVRSAAPHLHFGLELPNRAGTHGDHTDTHYVDPAPFLVRATVVQAAERKRAIKPTF